MRFYIGVLNHKWIKGEASDQHLGAATEGLKKLQAGKKRLQMGIKKVVALNALTHKEGVYVPVIDCLSLSL